MAEGAAWPDSVILPAPLFDDDLCFLEGIEDPAVKGFVPKPAIEALNIAVLPCQSREKSPRSPMKVRLPNVV